MDLGMGYERKGVCVRMTLGFWSETKNPSSQKRVEPVWAGCPGLEWELSPSLHVASLESEAPER